MSIILAQSFLFGHHILQHGGSTISQLIAINFGPGRPARHPGPPLLRLRAVRAHPGRQPGRLGHRQPVPERRRGRPVSTGSDVQSAPPGVLVPNTSASTGTLSSGNVGRAAQPAAVRRRRRHRRPRGGCPTPLRPSDFGSTDVVCWWRSALGLAGLVWVVFYQLTLLSGAFGFFVCWYLVFLGLTWLGTAQVIERQVATDRVVAVVVVSAALLVVGLVVFIVLWVAVKAVPPSTGGRCSPRTRRTSRPPTPTSWPTSGIAQAIVGTLEQVAHGRLIGVPLAIATAVFLNEVGGRGVEAGAHRGDGHERHPLGGGRHLHLLDAHPHPRHQVLGHSPPRWPWW